MARQEQRLTNGRAAAAILAAGIGSAALGLIVVLAEAIPALAAALNIYGPAGPLSGKTTVAVVVWAVAWAVAHGLWKEKTVDFDRVFRISLVLIAVGLLGTFPPFFELFGH